MHIEFHGAAGEVTGSCHLVVVNGKRILLDCGMFQGRIKDEARNREPFPFDASSIDAVILSHSHIDHSGRIPLLVKSGFSGTVYTHRASRDLCRIMFKDAAGLSERDAKWENRKRERKHLPLVEALYTVADAQNAMAQLKGLQYGVKKRILPGVTMRLSDAGHILGSSIVELWLTENGVRRKLVFSGDLGHNGAPILRDVSRIEEADLVLMESTYGDRLHRTLEQTKQEIFAVQEEASRARGNILIPAFAVGRSQELLFLFGKYYKEWNLRRWHIFLDSPWRFRLPKCMGVIANSTIAKQHNFGISTASIHYYPICILRVLPISLWRLTRFVQAPLSSQVVVCVMVAVSNTTSSTISGAAIVTSLSPVFRQWAPWADSWLMVHAIFVYGERPLMSAQPFILSVAFLHTLIRMDC